MIQGQNRKSVLEPYFSELIKLRKLDKSYQYISEYLLEKYGVEITRHSIAKFLKFREKNNIKPYFKTRKNIMNSNQNSSKASDIFMSKKKKKTKILSDKEIDKMTEEEQEIYANIMLKPEYQFKSKSEIDIIIKKYLKSNILV